MLNLPLKALGAVNETTGFTFQRSLTSLLKFAKTR